MPSASVGSPIWECRLGLAVRFVYSATQNNGQITSVVDSGETITMQYDALKRLISTAGNGWSQSYTFDGFGNLATKTGVNAPSWNGGSLPATNRVPGFSYDLNGNQLNHNGFTLSYDILNRLEKAESSSQKSEYDYAADNKRIVEKRWTGTGSSWTSVGEWVYFYGIDGKRLGRYALSSGMAWSTAGTSVWFGGKLAQKVDGAGAITWPNEDRLGSVGRYHAFGEDRGGGNPAADSEKFATYTRDGVTGLDYADQRWHSPGVGRFLTADPYQASGGPGEPGSWNRYGYVQGDPANYLDRSGLMAQQPEGWSCGAFASDSFDCWGGDPQGGLPLGAGLACLSGGCIDVNSPGVISPLTSSKSPRMPSPEGTGRWATLQDRLINIALLESLAESARATIDPEQTVAYLQLSGDCIQLYNPFTQGTTRNRTYTAVSLDGLWVPHTAANARIVERILAADGLSSSLFNNPFSSGVGTFSDQLGLAGYGPNLTTTVYQYFVTTLPNTSWQNVPTFVHSAGGDRMVLSITMQVLNYGKNPTDFNVWINGDQGMWFPNGQPRLPMCH